MTATVLVERDAQREADVEPTDAPQGRFRRLMAWCKAHPWRTFLFIAL